MNLIHFGDVKKPIIMFLHPTGFNYKLFEKEIEYFKKDYHVIAVEIEGHEKENRKDFTTVENNSYQIIDYLKKNNYTSVELIAGVSLGGSIAVCIETKNEIDIKNVVLDGAIAPINNRYAVLANDVSIKSVSENNGKIVKNLIKKNGYNEEKIKEANSFLESISLESFKNLFLSIDNYPLLEENSEFNSKIYYWYGELEEYARRKDLEFFKNYFKDIEFKKFLDYNHAEVIISNPDLWIEEISKLL